MNKTIAIIKGDGIGPEIVTEAMGVLDAVASKFGHTFTYVDAPMGGSAIDAINQIKKHGAKRIKFIGLVGAPEGIEALHKAHPDVDIYLGAKDDHLNENGYIVPGLGDAGDRIYGTK